MSTTQASNASNATETGKPAYAPCAWGVFKGDRVSVSAKADRAYVTAYRGKDRVRVALDKKGVARLLEILQAATPAPAAPAAPQEASA